jgi:quercetin dioxygenase-like cupin family protein
MVADMTTMARFSTRGTLQLTVDGTGYTLRAGDSAYYAGDSHHLVNPGRESCVYYLAMELVQRGPHARLGRTVPAGPRRRF